MTTLANIKNSTTIGKGLTVTSTELRSEYKIFQGTLVKYVTGKDNGGGTSADGPWYYFVITPSDLGLSTFHKQAGIMLVNNGDEGVMRNFLPHYYSSVDQWHISLKYVESDDYNTQFNGLVRCNYVYIATLS